MRRFTDDEMASDPPPPAPVFSSKELPAAEGEEKPSRSSEWFKANRVARVPLIALETDVYRVEGQNWACFSMIKPSEYGCLKHNGREYHGNLIKFRGVFETREEAERHIHRLMKVDRHFDIHLVPAFQWANADDSDINDREYATDMISEVMKGYFKQENHRMLGIRERIERTEAGEARSEEATRFFEEANRPALQEPAGEADQDPISLDELAARMHISPRSAARAHDAALTPEQVQSVVSTVLLEE